MTTTDLDLDLALDRLLHTPPAVIPFPPDVQRWLDEHPGALDDDD